MHVCMLQLRPCTITCIQHAETALVLSISDHGRIDPGRSSDFIQAWRIEKHESGNSFFWGGGISEEVKTLGEFEALPPLNDRLPRTVSTKSIMIHRHRKRGEGGGRKGGDSPPSFELGGGASPPPNLGTVTYEVTLWIRKLYYKDCC